MKTPLIALAASLAMLTAIPASAETVTVEHRDLNLSSAEGQAALDQRIDRAARQVCGLDDARTATRLAPLKDKKCYRQAKAEVKKQVAAAVAAQQLGG